MIIIRLFQERSGSFYGVFQEDSPGKNWLRLLVACRFVPRYFTNANSCIPSGRSSWYLSTLHFFPVTGFLYIHWSCRFHTKAKGQKLLVLRCFYWSAEKLISRKLVVHARYWQSIRCEYIVTSKTYRLLSTVLWNCFCCFEIPCNRPVVMTVVHWQIVFFVQVHIQYKFYKNECKKQFDFLLYFS